MRGGKRPVDGAFVTFWRILVEYPEVLAWERLWNEGLRDTYRDMYRKAHEIAPAKERMQRKFPKANVVQRPSARPFAAYSGHDPDGNVFDLAQRKGDTRKEIYADIAAQTWAQDRYMNRFVIRTPNAEQVALV